MSESAGRNASERNEASKPCTPKAEPASVRRRQHGTIPRGARDGPLRRGYSDGMSARTNEATGETLLAPSGNDRRKSGSITGAPGKRVEGERESEGFVVARKAGNAAGAKGPC